jgi:hypothetical protein
MSLYELVTSATCESYERAYAWAESEEDAKNRFALKHPTRVIRCVRMLLSSDSPAFVTELDDIGWPGHVEAF